MFTVSADFNFNRSKSKVYGVAGIRVGLMGFRNEGMYYYKDRVMGRDTTYYVYEQEGFFSNIIVLNGGVAFTLPVTKHTDWYTAFRTGPVMLVDTRGNLKPRYGGHAELATGARVHNYISAGLKIFYTNAWLEPIGPLYKLHANNIYSGLAICAEVKVRIAG